MATVCSHFEETEEERQARYTREADEMKLKWDARPGPCVGHQWSVSKRGCGLCCLAVAYVQRCGDGRLNVCISDLVLRAGFQAPGGEAVGAEAPGLGAEGAGASLGPECGALVQLGSVENTRSEQRESEGKRFNLCVISLAAPCQEEVLSDEIKACMFGWLLQHVLGLLLERCQNSDSQQPLTSADK